MRTEQIGALKPNENDLNKSSNQDHVPGRLVLLLQARDGEEQARLLGRATGAFLDKTRKSSLKGRWKMDIPIIDFADPPKI